MTAVLYVLGAYLALWPLSWAVAFAGGWVLARRGLTEIEFTAHVQRLDGHVARTFAHLGYGVGRQRSRAIGEGRGI